MSAVVKLSEVVEALDYPEEWECFLDRKTGKVVPLTENEAPYLHEEDEALEDLPEWQRGAIREVRRALESPDCIPLPGKWDVREWDIMRRFSSSQAEPARTELLDAIHGSGAFQRFRRTIERLGLRDAWFKYRDEAFEAFAREWLEENGIEFVEE